MSKRRNIIHCCLTLLLLFGTLPFSASAQSGTRPRRSTNDPQPRPTPPQQQPTATPQPTPPVSPTPQPSPDQTTGDDDEVVRVETELTNILFTANDKNRRFLTGLRQEDIRVYEDNVPQEIFAFQQQTDLPLSLAILVDRSGSQERTIPDEKAAALQFINTIFRPNKDEIAIVSFTGEVHLETGLTGNISRVRRAVDELRYVQPSATVSGGRGTGTPPINDRAQQLAASTALWDSIYVTSDEVLRETPTQTRRAIILLTDGVDTSSEYKLTQAIDQAVKTDVIVYSIGIGDNYYGGVDTGSLKKISERTGGRAYFPRSEQDLREAFAQIQEELRKQFLVAYSPSNRAQNGAFRQVKIEIVNPELRTQGVRLTYRQGYFARGNAPSSTAPASTTRPSSGASRP